MHMDVEIKTSHPRKPELFIKTRGLYMFDLKSALYLTTKVTSISASEHKNLTFSQGTINIAINEYQKDANGNVTAYVDNKSVVLGQKVSKIVKIKLTGKVGNVTETKKKEETPKTTPTTTPKPSTVASATDQAGVPNVTSVDSVINDGVPGTGDNAPTAILAICWLVAAIGFACFMGQKKKRGGEKRGR